MSVREKLLEAIDGAIEDLPDDLLVGILLDQLKQTRATLKEAQTAVIAEGVRSYDIEKRAHEEIRSIRSIRSMQGDFYFTGGVARDPIFIVSIGKDHVRMCKREGRIDYSMMQISADEYLILMEQQ